MIKPTYGTGSYAQAKRTLRLPEKVYEQLYLLGVVLYYTHHRWRATIHVDSFHWLTVQGSSCQVGLSSLTNLTC